MVPAVRAALNQLNEQERQLDDQEADAYAQLDAQVKMGSSAVDRWALCLFY